MRILLTGSTGFIGSSLLEELLLIKKIKILAVSRTKNKSKTQVSPGVQKLGRTTKIVQNAQDRIKNAQRCIKNAQKCVKFVSKCFKSAVLMHLHAFLCIL